MPITTWIRDLLGIPKDAIDLKKSQLELKKLTEEDKRTKTGISIATFEEVKDYDPKVEAIRKRAEERDRRALEDWKERRTKEITPKTGGCANAIVSLLLLFICGLLLAQLL